ncbi:TerB family tellurite resistance protein [Tropicimonas sp. TH_r6]|uniref:TerB family tellurite resistance protein n=1 Tax=Tropicimonas sp. TH_r6 TaxID=3082085 RepID=UPI0029531E0B|nr:TerB family tellurite resistance protein [Tropicimonas sp. TH_r6]MDV7145256.1 TerB family tellurite resistance protein [Tropicimonas sp. TH_r6]
MSIWSRISAALSALASGEPLSDVFDRLRTPPEKGVAFTIAVIALGAKLAKADGEVTRDEVRAFREVFIIAEADEANAARVFNLARQDVAGYDVYARRIAALFEDGHEVLRDLMEGLFHIAIADGDYHEAENEILAQVAKIFGLSDLEFRSLRARSVPDAEPDPYEVLGVSPEMPLAEIRKVWHREVRTSHPDVMIARGVPEEAIRMAEQRLIALNRAWEQISA